MEITRVFAGMAVTDYNQRASGTSASWGGPPDVLPKQDEAMWQVASTGLIYVVADRTRAGSGLLTIAVDDLQGCLAQLGERGISKQIDTLPSGALKVVGSDPDGNTITFFGQAGSGN